MGDWIRKHKIFIISLATIFVLIVVPFCINEAYKKNSGYITVWQGEAVLAYFGSAISAVGTILLGVIAWQQNTRLLKIEENNFLASNAVSAFITEVTITGIKQKAVNFKLHEEQILSAEDFDENAYFTDGGSIALTCKLEPLNGAAHIAMVHVEQIDMICSMDSERTIDASFSATNIDKRYTRVATSKAFDQFKATILIPGAEKAKLIKALSSNYSEISVYMTLTLLSDKYVATELKCCATLKCPSYDEKEGIYTHFKTIEENPPTCFWKGTSLKNKQDIIIKSVQRGN